MKEDIVKKYMTPDKQLAIARLVTELNERIEALEEAMAFIVSKYEDEEANKKVTILVPEHLKNG